MPVTIRHLILALAGLLFLFVVLAEGFQKPIPASPRIINLEEYTALRAELSREVEELKTRVKKLEQRNPSGSISVYEIDTMAGRLRCMSCVQLEEKAIPREQ